MQNVFIGRQAEIHELERISHSEKAEFVAIYGRRRIGKTYLVKEFYNYRFTFYATGVARGNKQEQLSVFHEALLQYGKNMPQDAPIDWLEAFKRLKAVIQQSRMKRKVVFLDELPWMDTQKSQFVKALDWFWNSWASEQNDLTLIVCGSAASWMVKNIIRNRGGLHNRITLHLNLRPFTLAETKEYIERVKHIRWDHYALAECYMIMGGIPYYLQYLDRTMSLRQNIDRIFFAENALLKDEYKTLFSSLFAHSEQYIRIIETLSSCRSGMTRDVISTKTRISNGGGLTRKLDELEQCGFIRKYRTVEKGGQIYQLMDFYCLFYFYFLRSDRAFDSDAWMHLATSRTGSAWLGLAFERLCFAHAAEIRKALGVTGVATRTFALNDTDAQVDMVIQRQDRTISVCEMKFSDGEYVIQKREWEKIEKRVQLVRSYYPGKTMQIVLVTARGLHPNMYSQNNINRSISLQDLFSQL